MVEACVEGPLNFAGLVFPFPSPVGQRSTTDIFVGKPALNKWNPSSRIWPIKSSDFRATSFSRWGPSGWDEPMALCTRMFRLPSNMPLTWSFLYNRNRKISGTFGWISRKRWDGCTLNEGFKNFLISKAFHWIIKVQYCLKTLLFGHYSWHEWRQCCKKSKQHQQTGVTWAWRNKYTSCCKATSWKVTNGFIRRKVLASPGG